MVLEPEHQQKDFTKVFIYYKKKNQKTRRFVSVFIHHTTPCAYECIKLNKEFTKPEIKVDFSISYKKKLKQFQFLVQSQVETYRLYFLEFGEPNLQTERCIPGMLEAMKRMN